MTDSVFIAEISGAEFARRVADDPIVFLPLVPPSGVLARAERSSRDKGELLMRDHVELVTKAVREAFTR